MSEFERNEVVTTDYGYEDEPCYYETEDDSKSGISTAVKVVGGLGLAALAGGVGYLIGKFTGRTEDEEDEEYDECEEDEEPKKKTKKTRKEKKQKKNKKKHKRSKNASDYEEDEDDNVVDGECKEVK